MKEKIHVFYSNDLHSKFENWSKITHFMKKQRFMYQAKKEEHYFVDIGDHVDRSHPIAEAFRGEANVQLLNEAEYDVVTIGNNEGITLEYEDLYHLYDDASFQVTVANLSASESEQPKWLQSKVTKTSESGLRITFFGLTAPFAPYYEPLGWNIAPPIEYLKKNIIKIKENSDILIFLSHLGLPEDERIAEQFPEIDVIIGGHTHHVLKNDYTHNGVLMTAAGKFGSYVGEVHLTWDHNSNLLVKKEAFISGTEHMEDDQETVKSIAKWNNLALEKLATPITTLERNLEIDWYTSTPLMEILTKRLKDWVNADIAMLNAGLILEGLPKGTVTYGDVHRICPHPINPCTTDLRGIEIMEIVRGAYDPKLIHLQLIGFGFRGKVIGKFIFDGLQIDSEVGDDGIERVRDVSYQGEPLDMNRTYRFVTADMFNFGQMFPEIVRAESKTLHLPDFLRNVLADALRNYL